MKTAVSIMGFGEVDDLSCNSLGMTSLHYLSFVYMVSENRVFAQYLPFLRSLA
jgi:hypothetical protein